MVTVVLQLLLVLLKGASTLPLLALRLLLGIAAGDACHGSCWLKCWRSYRRLLVSPISISIVVVVVVAVTFAVAVAVAVAVHNSCLLSTSDAADDRTGGVPVRPRIRSTHKVTLM